MRICFFGDSLIAGTGDPAFQGWVGRLCAASCDNPFDITAYNLGVRGQTSRDIAARWSAEAAARLQSPDDAVLFSFGVNDTALDLAGKRRIPLEESLENARRILEEAAERYRVLMVGPPPVSDPQHNLRLEDLSQNLLDVCRRADVPMLDVLPELKHHPIWHDQLKHHDNFHPGSEGYALLAEVVRNWSAWQTIVAPQPVND